MQKSSASQSTNSSAQWPKVWCEEGSRRPDGTFKRWLVVCNKAGYPALIHFPWPFVDITLDYDKLLAYYHATRYKGWPSQWERFEDEMRWHAARDNGLFMWLHPVIPNHARETEHYLTPENATPEEFLNAFSRSS